MEGGKGREPPVFERWKGVGSVVYEVWTMVSGPELKRISKYRGKGGTTGKKEK